MVCFHDNFIVVLAIVSYLTCFVRLSMETETSDSFQDLSKFVFKRVLNDNSQRKLICVEGEFADKKGATILLLEKKAFTVENVKLLCNEQSRLKKGFINDVYGSYEVFPQADLNGNSTLSFFQLSIIPLFS